jgi:hypothetical protein
MFDMLEDLLDPRSDRAHDPKNAAIINRCSPSNQKVLANAIQAAHDKIHSYYSRTWADMYAIAVILDPRLKMAYYKHCDWEPCLVAHAKDALQRAVGVYGAVPPQPDAADDSDRMDKWPYKKLKLCHIDQESELDRYVTISSAHVLPHTLSGLSLSHKVFGGAGDQRGRECFEVVEAARRGVPVPGSRRTRLPCHPCNQRPLRARLLEWSQLDQRQEMVVGREDHPGLLVSEELAALNPPHVLLSSQMDLIRT